MNFIFTTNCVFSPSEVECLKPNLCIGVLLEMGSVTPVSAASGDVTAFTTMEVRKKQDFHRVQSSIPSPLKSIEQKSQVRNTLGNCLRQRHQNSDEMYVTQPPH